MTSQLKEVIRLTKALTLSEQLELLGALSTLIQQSHASETQPQVVDDENFSAKSFCLSLRQAVDGKTLPLSQLWEETGGA